MPRIHGSNSSEPFERLQVCIDNETYIWVRELALEEQISASAVVRSLLKLAHREAKERASACL
jgi:hypothetical protein